jgi:hypothetical protein
MIVLGLDPGVTTGWGVIEANEDLKLKVLQFGMTKDQTLLEVQDWFRKSDLVVIESFLVRPKHARTGAFDWDPLDTVQVIGAAKLLCRICETPYTEQQASQKPVGYGFLKKKYVQGKKNMHAWDALAHAAFYLVKNGKARPVL